MSMTVAFADWERGAGNHADRWLATLEQRLDDVRAVMQAASSHGDDFIGAQAQAEGWTLLTRDATRYRRYFPQVELICP